MSDQATTHTPAAPWKHKDKRGRFLSSDPWRAENDDSSGYSSVAVHDAQGRVVALVVADGDADGMLAANAALIASAPDMLAALRVAEAALGEAQANTVIRAAIARATQVSK